MTKRVISVFLCVLCVISSISFIVSAKENKEYTSDNFLSVADGIIAWKKADNGSEPDGYLINDKNLENYSGGLVSHSSRQTRNTG